MDLENELRALGETVAAQQRQIEALTASRGTAAAGDSVPATAAAPGDVEPTRRGFFAKAVVAGAAGAAGLATTARPAAAGVANGEEFTLGEYNQATETTTLFRATSSAKPGLDVSVDGPGIAIRGTSSTKEGVRGVSSSGDGVFGLADSGDGVVGVTIEGRAVVADAVGGGVGLSARSGDGVGAVVSADGGIPLVITPGDDIGPPTSGTHAAGSLYADSSGDLYYCVDDGTPGDFVRLTTDESLALLFTPERAYDSRPTEPGSGTKGKFAAGETRTIDLGLDADVIDSDTAVLLNVTVTGTSGAGFGAVYSAAAPTTTPTFSSINWTATGQTIGNNVQSRIADRSVKVYTSQATHVIIDVVGFVPGPGGGPLVMAAKARRSIRPGASG